jgi:hypothetical protein
MFAFQMIAHKALRYGVPFLLIAALVVSGWAGGSVDWLRFAFLCQLAFYGAAIVGLVGERLKIRLGPLAIPYYFVLVNAASLIAFLKALWGETYVVWEPVRDARAANPGPEAATSHDS